MSFETPQTKIARYLAESLHERLLDYIKRSWRPQRPEVDKAQDRLVDLRGILQSIWVFHIYDRHKQISNDCLEDWLWRFKDFFYMTENVLDDLDFIEFRSREWQGDDVSEIEEMHFMKAIEQLPEVIETAAGLFSEIKHFNEELIKSKPVYSGLDQQIDTSLGLRTLPYKVRELKGRAAEKKKILEALFHIDEGKSKESPVMIWITGPVGIGKTGLARAVYNSAQVEAEFDVRAWIYKGKEDDWWLTLQRSESASVDQPSKLHISSFMYIWDILEKEMTGKKVLIVLDGLSDMRYYYHYVESIFSWYYHSRRRFVARLIVTTQFACTGILDTVSVSLNVELDGLEEEEYLELFKECALGDRNPNEHPELEDIVGEIAKRFGGNPLAAVLIGRHLKWHQSEDRWRLISRSNLGMIDPTESNIISVFKHSYEKLTGDLMHYYLACALFPKNYPFKENQLVSIWSAIGCWSHTYDMMAWTWEDIGSFFVSSARKDGEFILHAIFHELADYICDGEFFRLEDAIKEEDDVVQIPEKARHVYVTADNFVKVYRVLQEKTHLRSLVICGVLSSEEHKSNFMGLLEEVLQNLKGLRLLMISVLPTGKLPDAIGGLRHLRYFELPIDTITEESIQELPTWLYDPGFVGLRQLQNLEELRGAIRKLQSGESSHTFKSIDKELSSRESSDPSVLPPLKFCKDDSEVLEEKNKVIETDFS